MLGRVRCGVYILSIGLEVKDVYKAVLSHNIFRVF